MKNIEKGKKVAITATAVTIALSLVKGLVGFLSGSVALIADAFHSMSDVFIIFATWVGLKISERKPNEKFPYGYYKAETIVSLIISLFIIAAGIGIMREAILFSTRKIEFGYVAMAVAFISSLISYVISIYEIKVGRSIGSNALVMNGYESRMDIFTSLAVLLGVASSNYNIPYVESLVSGGISLMLIWYGIKGLYESTLILMDACPDTKLEKKIREITKSIRGVVGIRSLKLRKAGLVFFGEADIIVEGSLNVEKAHEISNEIESVLKEKIPALERMTIHVEPSEKERFVVAVPVKDKFGREISEKFSRSPYFALVEIDKKNVKGIKVIKNPFVNKKIRAGLSVGKFIVDKADVILTKEIGEISFHVLRDNFVKIFKVETNSVEDALKSFIEGRLKELHSETREIE